MVQKWRGNNYMVVVLLISVVILPISSVGWVRGRTIKLDIAWDCEILKVY